jgi:zinc D-Ala-D-Ala carboxypeptidase
VPVITAMSSQAISWRVSAIEQLLASRSGPSVGARSDEPWAAPHASAAFDPFGAAYQQALVSAAVTQPGQAAAATVAAVPTSAEASFAVRRVASGSDVVRSSSQQSVGQVGGYGVMPVPAELAGYGNGQIPPDALEPIGQDGHRLWAPAAESYKQLVAAAKADGIDLTVTDSYRTYAQQVELAERKGLYADGGLAAVPGTSNHGWGLAVDFNVTTPEALEWLQANGHTFGFVEAVKREPWHWEYRPSQA